MICLKIAKKLAAAGIRTHDPEFNFFFFYFSYQKFSGKPVKSVESMVASRTTLA
jgi:hypothetical protein